jgi:cobalt-zinc-cadmium efflux system outer membrane protein
VEAAGPLSLDAALALAFQANAELRAAAHELEAVDAAVIQAGVLPNPDLATLIEDTRRETRSTTLQLNQPIELGGKRAARVEAAERARDAAGADLAARRSKIRAGLIAAFFDTLIAQERVRLAGESAELARRGTAAAARRVAAGKVSPVEETKARVAEAGVKVELAQAASALRSARQRLAAFWGNPSPRFAAALGQAETLPVAGHPDDLVPRLDATPLMRRAGLEVERRRALSDVERARRIPDVTVSLGVKRDEQLGRNQAIVGLSIPLPLFNRNQGNVAEALRREDKARDELAATRIRLQNEAAQAWERLETARSEAATLAGEVLPGAQAALAAATKGFELGKFGFLDVLDAQRTLFQARSQHLRALAEAHRARAELDRLLGADDGSAVPAPR